MRYRTVLVRAVLVLATCTWFATRSLATESSPHVAQALADLEKRIRIGEIPNVHGVIVMRKGVTLAEWYFEGADERRGSGPIGVVKFGPATLHDVRSVTKSVVSVLFGIAMADGAIKELDTAVLDYFPEYNNLQTAERRRITLRHLLSMTSGLRWDESTYPYTDRRNSETAMDLADDPVRYALEQPPESSPGSQFRYNGGSVVLIAEVLRRATKMSLEDFATQALFAPLGITQVEWVKDARGVPYAASGLRLLPRDMAKIGRLMLEKGSQGGRQIVPEAWVKASVSPQALVGSDGVCGFHYGYFWWILPTCAANPASGWYSAFGNGGQRIFVLPEQELIVVLTAGLYNDGRQTAAVRQVIQGVRSALSR
jgi:CubicO group peptidase (beta-lactamase class C family)